MQATTTATLRLKKILVAVDFSPASKEALRVARQFARFFDAELTLLHVVERLGLGIADENQARVEANAELITTARKNLAALTAVRTKTRSLIRYGLAPHRIVEGAKEMDADLIVLATRGDTGLKRLWVGSMAEQVVRTAGCPVLVVQTEEQGSRAEVRRILVPTDFSASSERGIDYAVALASQLGAEVVLLNVIASSDDDELASAEAKLREMTEDRPEVSSTVRRGYVPDEVTRAAVDLQADLIVMATHGETSWRNFCLGSNAEAVVQATRTSVLVVREKEHELI